MKDGEEGVGNPESEVVSVGDGLDDDVVRVDDAERTLDFPGDVAVSGKKRNGTQKDQDSALKRVGPFMWKETQTIPFSKRCCYKRKEVKNELGRLCGRKPKPFHFPRNVAVKTSQRGQLFRRTSFSADILTA